MKAKLLIPAALLAIGLAGCAVPYTGTVTPASTPKTAVESTTISQQCRDDLNAVPYGSDVLNNWDVGMAAIDAGALKDPEAERANLLAALRWGAEQVGVTSCG